MVSIIGEASDRRSVPSWFSNACEPHQLVASIASETYAAGLLSGDGKSVVDIGGLSGAGMSDIALANDERDDLLAALAEAFPRPQGLSMLLGQLGVYLGVSSWDDAALWRRLSERLTSGEISERAFRSLVLIGFASGPERPALLRLARRIGILERGNSPFAQSADGVLGPLRGAARGPTAYEADSIEDRTLNVEVEGSINAGMIVVYASVALAGISAEMGVRSLPFSADVAQPAVLMVSSTGLIPRDETVAEIRMEPGRSSATMAFRFTVLPDGPYAITVSVHQAGRELARILVQDLEKGVHSRPLSARRHPVDVYLSVAENGTLTLLTADLSHRFTRFDTKLAAAPEARRRLDGFVARMLATDMSARTLDRELRIIGKELSGLLPTELLYILAAREDLSVLIDHPADLDFPFELVLIEHDYRDSFLGERHRVTRWISPSPAPSDSGSAVSRTALITNSDYLGSAETELTAHVARLSELSELDCYEELAIAREQVFAKNRFELIAFVTHLEVRDGNAGLRFRDEYLRPGDFLIEHRVFASSVALVFINACSSTLAAERFYGRTSFPGILIGFGVRATIATALPVEPALAVEFADRFFQALDAVGSLGAALRMARQSLVDAAEDESDRGRRRLAAIAYCGFGHPDLSITFTHPAVVKSS